ncbi:MAG: hypothetical protein IJ367_04180 [Clostridia bacterium]|nr:hypothetical protein [Clostridia bacterium]
MIVLGLCFLLCEILRYLEFQKMIQIFKEEKKTVTSVQPPKSRSSFVVKRMEEKLKQALYPEN